MNVFGSRLRLHDCGQSLLLWNFATLHSRRERFTRCTCINSQNVLFFRGYLQFITDDMQGFLPKTAHKYCSFAYRATIPWYENWCITGANIRITELNASTTGMLLFKWGGMRHGILKLWVEDLLQSRVGFWIWNRTNFSDNIHRECTCTIGTTSNRFRYTLLVHTAHGTYTGSVHEPYSYVPYLFVQ